MFCAAISSAIACFALDRHLTRSIGFLKFCEFLQLFRLGFGLCLRLHSFLKELVGYRRTLASVVRQLGKISLSSLVLYRLILLMLRSVDACPGMVMMPSVATFRSWSGFDV